MTAIHPQVLQVAITLAAAHNHEWACLLQGMQQAESSSFVCPTSTEEISQIVLAARESWQIPGIDAPTVDARGGVHHTTGTGRVRWFIFTEGGTTVRVNFDIRRAIPSPRDNADDGEVLTASVCIDADGSLTAEAQVVMPPTGWHYGGAPIRLEWQHMYVPYERHYRALDRVFRALGVEGYNVPVTRYDLTSRYNADTQEYEYPVDTLAQILAEWQEPAEELLRQAASICSMGGKEHATVLCYQALKQIEGNELPLTRQELGILP